MKKGTNFGVSGALTFCPLTFSFDSSFSLISSGLVFVLIFELGILYSKPRCKRQTREMVSVRSVDKDGHVSQRADKPTDLICPPV